MTRPVDVALRYARNRLPVFPLWPVLPTKDGFICGCGKTSRCTNPGKHPLSPLAPHGLKNASTDEKIVADWWISWPNANIAIATDRLVVIDIDPRHGGDAALALLETKHGNLPPTWRVKTGGGGLHIYFAAPPDVEIKNTSGQLGAGIDVRGRGGYVVAPPSQHISGGSYAWAPSSKDLAPMPAWLVAALQQPRTKAPTTAWRELVCQGVTEGKRNDAVMRLSGHLLRRYVDPLIVLELVMAWNMTRCAPPLSPVEIRGIVNSISTRELARRLAA